MVSKIYTQAKNLLPILLLIYLPALVVLLVAGLQNRVPFSYLSDDPAYLTGSPLYLGLFSNIGMLFWGAAATISLFCAWIVRGSDDPVRWGTFFRFSALLTLLLLIDDLFLIHELVGRIVAGGEIIVQGTEGVIYVAYLVVWWKTIRQTEFVLLFLVLGFFSLSLIVDLGLLDSLLRHWHNFVEDTAKILGIGTWLTYIARTGAWRIRRSVATDLPRRSPPGPDLSSGAPL
jgi:hypothetical protein